MTAAGVERLGATNGPHCTTCADEGIEMTVVEMTQHGARCRDPRGTARHVEIELVEPVAVGEVLLVHAGVAIVNLGAPS